MLVRYTLGLEDHLAWYDYYCDNSRRSVWSRVPVIGEWISARHRQRFTGAILKPESHSALGERMIELLDSGIREFSPRFDFATPWQDIVRVVTTEQHLFFVHSSMNAHIVPLRFFDSDARREAFLSFALSRKSPTLGSVYEFLAMRKAATKVTAAVKVAWSLS